MATEFLGKLAPAPDAAEGEWEEWYKTIAHHFEKRGEKDEEAAENLYYALIESVALASLVTLWLNPDLRHPVIWGILIVLLVASWWIHEWVIRSYLFDVRLTANKATAFMLKEIHSRNGQREKVKTS